MKVEFYKHNLDESDKSECWKVLDSLFLTTGETVKLFEKKFAEYLNIEHAVGLTSCTAALHLALLALGIKEGDEVITTPMSFIATANAVEYCGAKPVFVDVEENTGNIRADLIEGAITPRTKAIIVVHLYGQMCDMKKIKEISDKHGLKIIEDCAHCIEGERDGIRPGQLGNLSCYSFYATKNITCGEGGAVACHSDELHDWLAKARLHGMSKNAADRYTKKYEHYDMEFLGLKCNMNNIAASLLVNQLDKAENFLERKEEIARIYNDGFKDNINIRKPEVLPGSKHARHLYTIWVSPDKRDEYMHKLQEMGIGVAVNFRPIHLMKYYRDKYGYKTGDFPVSERIGGMTITLPFYPKLSGEEIDYVIRSVKETIV